MNGAIGVGYRLFEELFYGKKIVIRKGSKILSRRQLNVINDYACITNKCSEFYYRALETSEALIMRRSEFLEQMEHPLTKQMKREIVKLYKKNI